ncbi:hypothetical protein B0H14DRAFT_2937474, partial [Mycena olivaceomarginata]
QQQFSIQDNVLCWYHKNLYPAKILQIKESGSTDSPSQRYFVHYIGWAKSWNQWRAASQILVDNAHNRSIHHVEESSVTKRTPVTPQSSLPPRFRINYRQTSRKTRDNQKNVGRGPGSNYREPERKTRVSFPDDDSVKNTLETHDKCRLSKTIENMCGAQSLEVISPETATHSAVSPSPSSFAPEATTSRLDVDQQVAWTVLEGLLHQVQEVTKEVAQIRNGIQQYHRAPMRAIHPLCHLLAPGFDAGRKQ